jgi:hypothetical protein
MGLMGLDFWSLPEKAEDFFSFPAVKKAATAHKVTGAQARVEREGACFSVVVFQFVWTQRIWLEFHKFRCFFVGSEICFLSAEFCGVTF